MLRHLHRPLIISGYICIIFFFLWCLTALYIDASIWSLLFLVLVCVISGFYFKSLRHSSLFVSVCCLLVLTWWMSLEPSNYRDWRAEVARLPSAFVNGNRVSITNVRNFKYKSENNFVENWETRNFNLDELVGADLFLNYWGPTQIAHTITTWRFSDGTHIAVSIEARKETHEAYSAYKGFFRQFEVYYVFADERDLIKLRTDHRGEQVYLYKLGFPLENAKALLLQYLKEINQLKDEARWYNALSHNCTTAIRYHSKQIGAAGALDWRMFINGYLDELGYERGVLDQTLSLQELREVSNISDKAKKLPADVNFSAAIRNGLPGFTQ